MAPAESKKTKTTVGVTDDDILAYTVGKDTELDRVLVACDCIGTAAHVTMLSRMPGEARVVSKKDAQAVIAELVKIVGSARRGKFNITVRDQDVHMAVERVLTRELGDLGRRVHTGRSRNDQVAVDLRLFAKERLPAMADTAALLARELIKMAERHAAVPMVGRTHLQPAMPSSVGLWAAAHAESLLDDILLLIDAHALNDQCPLGAAAGYGVPLPVDRELVAELLGFSRPCQTVLYAITARGKIEAVILSAMVQVMLTLSRLAEDLVLFTMPEFGYFELPDEFCTGSSIMPQKKNPDVLELMRARAHTMIGRLTSVLGVVSGLPSGYQRDVQETKEPYLEGMASAEASLRIALPIVKGLRVNREKLVNGFTGGVFATDRALELVRDGKPFRDAYNEVKADLSELESADPYRAIAEKMSLGDTAGIPFDLFKKRITHARQWARAETRVFERAAGKVLGISYPDAL